MNSFSDYEFRAKVDAALETVRKILDTTKHPARPADVPHVYDDKYGLVEQATKAAIVASLNALEVFGVNGAALDGMRNWVKANKVKICRTKIAFFFFCSLDCSFKCTRKTTRSLFQFN